MLALAGALVAPLFIDWTAYRADFEREATRILGRQVIVKGEASATLLPFPSVTFEDVEVLDAQEAPLLSIGRFRMDAELAPYLSGEILIYSMTLERPEINVPIEADGSVEWVLARPQIPTGATVVLENVLVRNGTVHVDNRITGRSHDLTGVEATLSADSLAGPFSGKGSLDVSGTQLGFSIDAGTLQPDGALPLRIETTDENLNAQIAIDGNATVVEGRPHFTGSASLIRPLPKSAFETGDAAADPFALASGQSRESTSERGGGEPMLALRATGKLGLSPSAAKLTDIRLQAGGDDDPPYLLTGTGGLDFGSRPRFSLDLTGEQIDVDAIAGTKPPAEQPQSAPDEPVALSDRVETVRRVLADVPRPAIEGVAKIALPVVVAGDTTIRDVAFAARPGETGWTLDAFSAELPGRTRLEASGTLQVDERFAFAGDILLASNQPSGFSDWLTGEVAPSVRTLPRAGFSAKAELTATRQSLSDLEVDIGGDTLKGRLLRDETGDTTKLVADLSGKAVDLDAFLALSRVLAGDADSLADADSYDVALDAGPVTLRDAAADRVVADFTFDGDRLQIDELNVEGLAGASVTASGTLSDVVGDATGQLDVSLRSQRPEAFFDFVTRRLPGVPVLEALREQARHLAPLSVAGDVETIEGEPRKRPTLYVRLDGTANGSKLDLSASIENGFSALSQSGRFGLDLRLENDRPTALLDQLGISAVDFDAPSPLEAELSLSAAATGPVVTTASLRAPGSEISFDGNVMLTPDGVTGVEAALYVTSEDVAPWLRTGAIDLGQSFLTVPVKLRTSIDYADGDWSFSGFEGSVAGNAVSAELALAKGVTLTGSAHLQTLSMPWLAGLVYGLSYDAGIGTDGWSSQAFRDSRLPEGDFSIALASDRLDLGNTELTGFSTQLSGSRGDLVFTNARGEAAGGSLAADLELRNANGVGSASLKAETTNFDLAALYPALDRVEESARLDGSIQLDGAGQSYQGLLGGLTGAGEVAVANVAIPGIAPRLMAPLLVAADADGFAVDTDVSAVVARISSGAVFPIPAARTEFSVSAGVIRFAPVTVSAGSEALTLDGSIDLADLSVSGDLQLAIDPGEYRIEGADPAIDYSLGGNVYAARLTPEVGQLSNFLSVRALEREQARVEAMQENLQETLRLRREARFYRYREGRAQAIIDAREQARQAAEARRRDAAREKAAAEAAARRAEEDAAAEKAAAEQAAERQAAAEAERQRARQAEAARRRQSEAPAPSASIAPQLDFDTTSPPRPGGSGYQSLPGVANPLDF